MNEPTQPTEAAGGRSDSTAELGNELPGRSARAMLPLLEELAERDAEIERLRGQLAEFQIVAYRREWDGDDSDFGNWIYAEADERDHIGVWEPVYAKVPNA